jgi:hypothetical protein
MINPFKEINWKPGATDLRKFAWSLIIGFPCIALVFFLGKWLAGRAMPEPRFFLLLGGIGAATGLVCLRAPIIARPLYHVWYALAACIGLVMSNLIFALMFYGIFTPMGLFMRLRGRDALNLKWRKGTATYWIDAPPAPPAAQYFNQY